MDRNFTLIVILTGIILSCTSQGAINEFERPTFAELQVPDSVQRLTLRSDSLVEVFPPFIGKYKFGDKVRLNSHFPYTTYGEDVLSEYRIGDDDSLDVIGLEFIVDYEQEVYFNPYFDDPDIWKYEATLWKYYPVYFVNSTNSDKVFIAKDRWMFGIQEALAEEQFQRWRPIESSGFDFCGNGGWGLIIHPKEFVVFLMPKYYGEVETEFRVRVESGSSTFVSKPFKGYVNPSQFQISKNSYAYDAIENQNGIAPYWLFYGAKSKLEEDWLDSLKRK